jgi:glycosyltransferase involved in cell wall biosynthesis
MANNAPLVSVIINVHNGAKYLGQAIDSVYRQTYDNFEIILYDNASTDDTPLFVSRYDKRLKYYRSERFLTLGEARNNALVESNGRYICFLDSDDMFLPEKLSKQVALFSPGVGMVYSNVVLVAEKTNKETIYYKRRLPSGRIFRHLLEEYCILIVAVMISREALGSDQSQWFSNQFTFVEDADLFIRLALVYDAVYIDEPLAKLRYHGDNFSFRNPEIAIKEKEMLLVRLRLFIPKFDEIYGKEIVCYQGWAYKTKALLEWQNGNRIATVGNYWRSFQCLGRPYLLLEALASIFFSFKMVKRLRGW